MALKISFQKRIEIFSIENFLKNKIQVYKIHFSFLYYKQTNSKLLVSEDNTRLGHNKKIYKYIFSLDLRKYSFNNKESNFWNNVPQDYDYSPIASIEIKIM